MSPSASSKASFAKALRCRECHREFPLEPVYVCDFCFGPLEVAYDYEAMRQSVSREKIERGPLSVWRYADLLPCDASQAVDIQAGFTPLVKADRLGEELGLGHLYLKNDCANPTWSFKDRVVTVAATKAREFGFKTLACASTGNLANSVAAHAARAGMEAIVFIPSDLERAEAEVADVDRVERVLSVTLSTTQRFGEARGHDGDTSSPRGG